MGKTHELSRSLGLKDAVAIGLGAIIGGGIFVVTGTAAGVAGPAFMLGLIIAGIIALFNGLSSAQLAAVFPQSGGTYEYGYRLLNPLAGFSAGWLFLISKLSAAGVVAIGFGSYVHELIPAIQPKTFSVMAIITLTAANYFGIKKAGQLNVIIVSITLLSLIYLIIVGLPEVKSINFQPFAPGGFSGIAESAALMFFAFTGYARIATLAEEVRNPQKNIPRAIMITIFTAIGLYLLVAYVAMGVLGEREMANNPSPLQEVSNVIPALFLSPIITIGASTAMLGVLLSQILGISRMMLAMGRRHDLAPKLKKVHHQYQVPHLGIIITGVLMIVITLLGSFGFILRAASFTILVYYSITNVAALQQPKSQQLYTKLIPILGLIGCLAMAISLPLSVITSGISLLLSGWLIKWIFNKLFPVQSNI